MSTSPTIKQIKTNPGVLTAHQKQMGIRIKRATLEVISLKEKLRKDAVYISNASFSLMDYCQSTPDPFINNQYENTMGSDSGQMGLKNPYLQNTSHDQDQEGGRECCIIM